MLKEKSHIYVLSIWRRLVDRLIDVCCLVRHCGTLLQCTCEVLTSSLCRYSLRLLSSLLSRVDTVLISAAMVTRILPTVCGALYPSCHVFFMPVSQPLMILRDP